MDFFFWRKIRSSDKNDNTLLCTLTDDKKEILNRNILNFFQNSQLSNKQALFVNTIAAVNFSLLNKNPKQPAIVTFVSSDDKNAGVDVNTLVIKLSEIINSNFCPIGSPPSFLAKSKTPPKEQKQQPTLDDNLKNVSNNFDLTDRDDTTNPTTFRDNIINRLANNATVVLTNLQKTPNQKSNVFTLQAVTDNFNAPFKQRIIFFTLLCSQFKSTMTQKQLFEIADECIKTTFSLVTDDQSSALFSRLGEFVYFG